MTATDYSVQVTITSQGATYTPQVATGNDRPNDVAAAYGLADPLVITQRLQENSRLPLSHPEPEEATITLIAPDSTTYAAIGLGDPVGVKVFPQAAFAGTPVTFYGRVAAASSEPHKLGVKITLSCVDYTADLAQVQIGGTSTWPIEFVASRFGNRIAPELGLTAGFPRIPAGWVVVTSPTLAARTPSYSDAYSIIVDMLDSWYTTTTQDETFTAMPGGGHVFSFRPCLVPLITGGLLDPVTPWQIRAGLPWTRRVNYAPPARLTNLAGVRTITVAAADSSPSTGAPILDAGRVDFGAQFMQQKAGGLFNVTQGVDAQGNRYTWDWRTETQWLWGSVGPYGPGGWQLSNAARVDPSGPAIVQEVDSILDVTDAGLPVTSPAGLVGLYRTPFAPDPRSMWNVGTLSWQAWAEPSPWRRPELTELLTVARGATGKLPNNREWLTGIVVGTTLTIQRGRPTFDISLMPASNDFEQDRTVRGASLGVASFDSPIFGTTTLAQLSTRDTFNDYALVRGS